MGMNVAENYMKEMEDSNIFVNKEMTFVEYVNDLTAFQKLATKMIMRDEYEDGMRLDEAIYRLESIAREKELNRDVQVRKGINALRTVNKEIAIGISGKRGEDFVARTLEYISRPNTSIFRNVYVTNDQDESELDSVIVTDSGIIILEIKSVKQDVTITQEGRLVINGDECYEKKKLGEKMSNKRRLLKQRLESEMKKRDINIPISVDSYIVFTSPKGMRVNIDDRYRREKWCYRTGLVSKIDNYIGFAYYSDKQIDQLNEMLSMIEANQKKFPVTINFDEIKKDFAVALELLTKEIPVAERKVVDFEKSKVVRQKEKNQRKDIKKIVDATPIIINKMKKKNEFVSMASGFAGIFVVGAVALAASVMSTASK